MDQACHYPLCLRNVPPVLEEEKLCPLHFLRKIEDECRLICLEAIGGGMDGRRSAEINSYLSRRAIVLAQLATSGTRLRDDARPCLLSAFLTLLNVCERLGRAGEELRGPVAMGGVGRQLSAAAARAASQR